MKLVIVGGSAHSTPNLFAHDPLRAMADSLEVVLVGRSSERLAAVAHAIELITEPKPVRVTCEPVAPGGSSATFRGADVVLCQARYGGYEARAVDESFPLKYGLCGDEGLGVGGLAAAWRTWPLLRATLEEIQAECPSARVILMTSPVGVLTRCALTAFPGLWLAGICELPWTTLRAVCATVGIDERSADFEYAGVNHLGWFWHIYASGRDVVAEFAANRARSNDFPSGGLLAQLRSIPLKYLRLHYDAPAVLVEQLKQERPRGQVLSELQERAYEVYRTGNARSISDFLQIRPTPWYEHAISPIIAGFAGAPPSIPFFLTVRNSGFAAEYGSDDVLEIPHRFAGGELTPFAPIGQIPAHLRTALDSFVAYERIAAEAVGGRDDARVRSAVRSHPWVRDAGVATQVVAEICR